MQKSEVLYSRTDEGVELKKSSSHACHGFFWTGLSDQLHTDILAEFQYYESQVRSQRAKLSRQRLK
ncbi:hypothetical protein Heshes_24340 [Alicyclobacillus hesperidum]|uniref:Uncharacterized protein n=1 Tax=Alicyclobacillus hesperidum TaxID=89784 RepID=A0A1H2X6M9_9BACL|nr:hypothetical protein Heshes_24340 [Alicyclobacillus hesperidum]SDW87929.1 hypothetical protein SAMN04489725_11845 [Alicyclobacillus hesperidum]